MGRGLNGPCGFAKITLRGARRMDYDQDKVDEAVLALLSLTIHDEDEWGAST